MFLDRDGVLNRTYLRGAVPRPPADVAEVEILPGVIEACRLLRGEGLRLIVVTNQPDVARGAQTRENVEAINRHLVQALGLNAVFVCYHDTADGCDCRKPQPGLLLAAARAHGIDLSASYMVGDRCSDVVAGQAAGCATFLIDAPYNERARAEPDHTVRDLAEAAAIIIGSQGRQG